MLIDSSLQFQEQLEIVCHAFPEYEFKVSSTVDKIKRQSQDQLNVHGSFVNGLGEQQLSLLTASGKVDRRQEVRQDCQMRISMKPITGDQFFNISVTNISSIGCCFQSPVPANLDERIELYFKEANQQVLTVPAVICRVCERDGHFQVGCSFMTSLELLAVQSSNQSSIDWHEKMTMLNEKMPNI